MGEFGGVGIEDWIRNVETLMDDNDDESLLTNFHDDCHESYDELISRIDEYVKVRSVPCQRIVDEIRDLIIQDVLLAGVNKIVTTWSRSSVSVEAQLSLRTFTDMLELKIMFLVSIYLVMLKSKRWKDLNDAIYEALNDVLLEFIPIIEKYQHHPNDMSKTAVHFAVKPYVSTICCTVWEKMIGSEGNGSVPADLIVPTMRRLGMLDILDDNWNMYGDWEDICTELRNKARTDQGHFDFNTNADKILTEKSKVWRSSRKSLRCRDWIKSDRLMFTDSPHAFQYFTKCSVMQCSNVETKKKPHPIRCKKCWYYHFCSEPCQRYCNMLKLHYCDMTPSDKVRGIKNETESFLGLRRTTSDGDDGAAADLFLSHEVCNFCSAKRINLPNRLLLSCSRCKQVAYCSQACQKWDWPEHKQTCSKN